MGVFSGNNRTAKFAIAMICDSDQRHLACNLSSILPCSSTTYVFLVFCLPAVLLWLPCSAAESEMTTPTPTLPNCELPACAAIASLSLTTTISYRGPSGMFLPYLLSGIRLALQHIIRYSYLGRPEEVVSLVLPHVFSAHLDSEVSQYRLYAHTSG